MLKAIGTSTSTVVISTIFQIVLINICGVALGALGTFILTLFFPVTIPLKFEGYTVMGAVVSLLAIGPLGGVVSVRTLAVVEPLTALGLSS